MRGEGVRWLGGAWPWGGDGWRSSLGHRLCTGVGGQVLPLLGGEVRWIGFFFCISRPGAGSGLREAASPYRVWVALPVIGGFLAVFWGCYPEGKLPPLVAIRRRTRKRFRQES